MPKVSVIVPVYGVEKYIERCAHSLFGQTLDDIEFLFVDDCTPDGSIDVLNEVLEKYPQRKSQVIIHRMEENSGQAKVREWGMKNATGEYVIHCDSDDWVDTNMYRTMYEKAKEENADVVVCDYVESDGDQILKKIKGCDSTVKHTFINNMLLQKVPWALWNKLFRREIYTKDLVFPSGNMGEDMALCFQMLCHSEKISYVPDIYYFYFFNQSSIMNSISEEKNLRNYECLKSNVLIVCDRLKRDGLYDTCQNGVIQIQFNSLILLFQYVNKLTIYKEFKNAYPTSPVRYLKTASISLNYKLRYLLSLIRVYPFIWRIIKR